MKKTNYAVPLAAAAMAFGLTMPLTSCVDDSYDVSKDIDLTMGLGSEGLQLKMGNTEKIMLGDILEVDDDLKTDARNTFYLVKSGQSTVDFSVKGMKTSINEAHLTPEADVCDFDKAKEKYQTTATEVSIDKDEVFEPDERITAKNDIDFEINDISSDVQEIKRADLRAGKAKVTMELTNVGTNFVLDDIKDLQITVPSCLRIKNATKGSIDGQVVTFNKVTGINATTADLGEVTIEAIEFANGEGVIKGNTLKLQNTSVTMEGKISIKAKDNFTMKSGSKTTVRLTVAIGEKRGDKREVDFASITGRFSPAINPDVDDINVSDNLPDILQDEEVTVQVANPTVKFCTDMTNVPASIKFSAQLQSIKGSETLATVDVPTGKKAEVTKEKKNTLYFYQGEAPYDPVAVDATASKHQVANLGKIIERVPDRIAVDLKDGKVQVKDEVCTVTLDKTYEAGLTYDLFVPFTFENGLRIVYNDSITDMSKDLEDYEADGVYLTADIFNTIPLRLHVSAEPVDAQGKVISGISVTSAIVDAAEPISATDTEGTVEASGKTTSVAIEMTLSDRSLLKQLDRLRLRITADGTAVGEKNGTLSSLQYIQVNNIRLRLKGQIVGNFN